MHDSKGTQYSDRDSVGNTLTEEQIKYFKDSYEQNRNGRVMYSDREIIGEIGTNYGKDVYLDSDKLSTLSEKERIDEVKKHIENLGGISFTAFDNEGNEVKINIAPKTKYINENGKPARANRHLTNFLDNEVKQESLMLIDEVILTARFQGKEDAEHPHGWLDNYGKNKWEVWTTYIQDKEKTIWEAKLKIANSTNGEKILYDVYLIEMVEQVGTMTTSTTEDNIPQDFTESQENFGKDVEQKITSAKTSIPQIPALFKHKDVTFGKTNIDIGGGKFDLATNFLAEQGTKNYVFDPNNRSEDVCGNIGEGKQTNYHRYKEQRRIKFDYCID